MSEEKEILSTLEEIRVEKFPELPKKLLQEIIKAQSAFIDHPLEAKDRIRSLIEAALNKKAEKC